MDLLTKRERTTSNTQPARMPHRRLNISDLALELAFSSREAVDKLALPKIGAALSLPSCEEVISG